MSDSTNLNKSSPIAFNQPTQPVDNPLTPAVTNPSTAATSAPPTAAPNVSTPIPQTAGSGSSAAQSSGLGGGVSVPPTGLGGGVSNSSPVLGDALTLGGVTVIGGGSGSSLIPTYPNVAALPAITAANVGSQARVQDIGDGVTAGLYVANAIGGSWSFVANLS